jgi:hypothetical protein
VCDWWGISVFDEMVDEPFIGDDCCQLREVVHAFADFGRQRERVEFSLENVKLRHNTQYLLQLYGLVR